jgi:hypothetical protein
MKAEHIQIAELMDWTIMPARLIAWAWTDDAFRSELLTDPTTVLRREVDRAPRDRSFRVVENFHGAHYLPLPARKPHTEGWSKESLLQRLKQETGNDRSLSYFLPAEVICEAWIDKVYKDYLLAEPVSALGSFRLSDPRSNTVVLENSLDIYHLVLPENPSRQSQLDFKAHYHNLLKEFGAESTKCCATGTCDSPYQQATA